MKVIPKTERLHIRTNIMIIIIIINFVSINTPVMMDCPGSVTKVVFILQCYFHGGLHSHYHFEQALHCVLPRVAILEK